ncbi:GIY-YIG nuclease family protein [Paenibacillus sambharensis]|uniref:GIY-YIG nuclease family protein n=1 Tax=Paenibacillus sambharensis TaxID=1803190 RepID=A0A2W1L9S5_9BACL|nr:GIY-YIG nuclease family protein [Paenibacillus sambharensis]PZD95653.1 GIY-YIG nuclease family protein [Paenibacillus sambharensis]
MEQSRKDLVRQYQDRKREMGIYTITNTENGKQYVSWSLNLPAAEGKETFELKMGGHRNKSLQEDWNRFGEAAFRFEIVEVLKLDDSIRMDYKDVITPEGYRADIIRDYRRQLEKLEAVWTERLGCREPNGYN